MGINQPPKSKAGSKPYAKTYSKTGSKPYSKTASKTDSKTGSKPYAKTASKTDSKIAGKADAMPKSKTNTKLNNYWMEMALAMAGEAKSQDEVPIGAVIARGKDILGCGYNCCISTSDPTAHAEIIAIRQAAETTKNYRMPLGATLYVTVEPCAMCVAAISNARISHVVFGCREPKSGALVSHRALLKDGGLNWKFSYEGGVFERESSELMRKFFADKRNKKQTI